MLRMKPGGVMTTDMWRAYPQAAQQSGVEHRTVNHSVEFKTFDGVHTNNVEGRFNVTIFIYLWADTGFHLRWRDKSERKVLGRNPPLRS